jgi:MFS family permease
VTGLAVAAGPVTGGLLLEHFWWGSIFLVNIPIALLALVAGRLLIPDSRDPRPGRLDRLGLVLSITAVAAIVWAVIEAPHRGWTSAEVVITGTTGLLLLAAFVVWELRHADTRCSTFRCSATRDSRPPASPSHRPSSDCSDSSS